MARRKSSWVMAGSEGDLNLGQKPVEVLEGRRLCEAGQLFVGQVVVRQVEHSEAAQVGRRCQGLSARGADPVAAQVEPVQVGQPWPRGQQQHTLVAEPTL